MGKGREVGGRGEGKGGVWRGKGGKGKEREGVWREGREVREICVERRERGEGDMCGVDGRCGGWGVSQMAT